MGLNFQSNSYCLAKTTESDRMKTGNTEFIKIGN